MAILGCMLGIDVSKGTLDCTLLESASRQPLWHSTFPNTASGIEGLLAQTPTHASLVLEPTGRYSRAVVEQAYNGGRSVLVAPTRRAKAFRLSVTSRAKTDRIDSKTLALFALSQPLLPYPIKSPTLEQLDQLLSARKGISRALTTLTKQRAELPHAAAALDAALRTLAEQKAALDKQIDQAVKAKPDSSLSNTVRRLRGVPGIGSVTAAAVASRLEHKGFAHPEQFVSFVGLDIGVRQSGKRQGDTGLTRQGDAELRRLL